MEQLLVINPSLGNMLLKASWPHSKFGWAMGLCWEDCRYHSLLGWSHATSLGKKQKDFEEKEKEHTS